MSEPFTPNRIHVVVGAPWKDAVFEFLEPPSRMVAFPEVHSGRPGDGLVVMFDCEPRIVLTSVGRIEATGGIKSATRLMMSRRSPGETATVTRVGAGLEAIEGHYALLDGAAATEVAQSLDVHRFRAEVTDLFGRSSATAVRLLLEADRRCTGCDRELDLSGASDAIEIRMVDALEFRPAAEVRFAPTWVDVDDFDEVVEAPSVPVDWPAVLCIECQTAMSDSGFHRFLDYKFSRYPACLRCGGQQTQRALFGMLPFDVIVPPWHQARGCCVTADNWTCTLCTHRW
jgi:hypothetical protein